MFRSRPLGLPVVRECEPVRWVVFRRSKGADAIGTHSSDLCCQMSQSLCPRNRSTINGRARPKDSRLSKFMWITNPAGTRAESVRHVLIPTVGTLTTLLLRLDLPRRKENLLRLQVGKGLIYRG